jgi:hypothetical protein
MHTQNIHAQLYVFMLYAFNKVDYYLKKMDICQVENSASLRKLLLSQMSRVLLYVMSEYFLLDVIKAVRSVNYEFLNTLLKIIIIIMNVRQASDFDI